MIGFEAIRNWKAETKRKYQHSIQPLSAEQEDDQTIVTARVAGNFPGSPVDLRFAFTIKDDKIASLEIT